MLIPPASFYFSPSAHTMGFLIVSEKTKRMLPPSPYEEGIGYKESDRQLFPALRFGRGAGSKFQKARKSWLPFLDRLLAMTDLRREPMKTKPPFISGPARAAFQPPPHRGRPAGYGRNFRIWPNFRLVRRTEERKQLWGSCLARVEEKLGRLFQ